MEFDQPEDACKTFAGVEALKKRIVVPERTVIEIVNCQAEAAVAQGNLELTCEHIQTGVTGALKFRSEKRFNDTLTVHKQAQLVWPRELRVKELADPFHR